MHCFTGTPYERGTQHGTQLAQLIRERVHRSIPASLDASQRVQLAEPWLKASEALDPELVSEMAGIAEGSDTKLEEVVLLNAFEAFDQDPTVARGGCTAVAVSTEDGVVLAQNWDADEQLAIGLAVHLHRPADGLGVAVLASPGGLGWIGMNECGLALVNNDLLGGPAVPGSPSQVNRRVLLKQSDVSSALRAAGAMKHPALRSYMLADATGAVAGIEVIPQSPPATVDFSPNGMVHANHAVTPAAQTVESRELQERVYPSSVQRAHRAADLLDESRGDADPHRRVRQLLCDHDGLPLSICRHESAAEETVSAASVVFDCRAGRAEFYLGPPCEPRAREVVDLGAKRQEA